MKRKGNIYDEILSYEKTLKMFNIIKKNANDKKNIYKFNLNLNQNIMEIIHKLENNNYKFNKYNVFLIKEPKFRLIMSECISDKIVNHLISEYILLPSLEGCLIDKNVATRREKGSAYAFNLVCEYINKLLHTKKEINCLKIDISKYFYNIDHDILKSMVRKKSKIKDV